MSPLPAGGPWRIEVQNTEDMGRLLAVLDARDRIIAVIDAQPVRSVQDQYARLIAAAPEMLAALETWLKFWDTMPKGQMGALVFDVGLLNDGFIQMRAALAKVRP